MLGTFAWLIHMVRKNHINIWLNIQWTQKIYTAATVETPAAVVVKQLILLCTLHDLQTYEKMMKKKKKKRNKELWRKEVRKRRRIEYIARNCMLFVVVVAFTFIFRKFLLWFSFPSSSHCRLFNFLYFYLPFFSFFLFFNFVLIFFYFLLFFIISS